MKYQLGNIFATYKHFRFLKEIKIEFTSNNFFFYSITNCIAGINLCLSYYIKFPCTIQPAMHKFALVKLCVMKIHRIIPHAVVDLVCRCTLSFLRLMMIFLHAFCNVVDSNPINIGHAQLTKCKSYFLSSKFCIFVA